MTSFSIRSSTIRLGIFISSLAVATILIFQLVWLKKVYRFEEKEFNHSIVKAIRGVYEDLEISTYYSAHLNELIENPKPNLYLARINLPINQDSLTAYLHYELEDFSIFTDCMLGVYDSRAGKFTYSVMLPGTGTRKKDPIAIPASSATYNHIALYFPNRNLYILEQMNFWIISSALLLLVLLLFGGSVYYFYRQKFLNETQKDFIHNFTHEFKTPVAVISLAADVLKDPAILQKPAKITTYAGIVAYQSNYLHQQIEKLLQFAYADSHQLHLVKEKVNIHELIQNAVDNLAPLIKDKEVVLKTTFNDADPFLNADRNYLVIVIMNLLDNAIKYSRKPVIEIETRNEDGQMVLSVTDNGIGIEKKQVKNIFKKFYRATSGEVYAAKGFGIGLSFIQKIITAHKGTISVETEVEKGSRFSIQLPTQ